MSNAKHKAIAIRIKQMRWKTSSQHTGYNLWPIRGLVILNTIGGLVAGMAVMVMLNLPQPQQFALRIVMPMLFLIGIGFVLKLTCGSEALTRVAQKMTGVYNAGSDQL